ncbi:hypothetical protein [Methylobacter psychrophilus]|uniref:hypothetical protein n=1 Tax=Methylobacter psychrophilus TaxID=96941 RepID=UPI0021D50997|nr:hypothetical protein [Methylobacter psychrophilus]
MKWRWASCFGYISDRKCSGTDKKSSGMIKQYSWADKKTVEIIKKNSEADKKTVEIIKKNSEADKKIVEIIKNTSRAVYSHSTALKKIRITDK